jgi:hypothetical protein
MFDPTARATRILEQIDSLGAGGLRVRCNGCNAKDALINGADAIFAFD